MPSLVANGGAAGARLTTRAAILDFNGACRAARACSAPTAPRHGFMIATFVLTERPGPGNCGAGTGDTARTAFRVRDGKITDWLRVRGPAGGRHHAGLSGGPAVGRPGCATVARCSSSSSRTPPRRRSTRSPLRITETGAGAQRVVGAEVTVIGVIDGDRDHLTSLELDADPGVDRVVPVSSPYKLAHKNLHGDAPNAVEVGGVAFGGPDADFRLILGPCAVESAEQTLTAARACEAAGADLLRGGAFKPRTSPYAFQGLGRRGAEDPRATRARRPGCRSSPS